MCYNIDNSVEEGQDKIQQILKLKIFSNYEKCKLRIYNILAGYFLTRHHNNKIKAFL